MDCCFSGGIGRRRLSRGGKSLYNELHVSHLASEREINAVFRRLALQYHPDKNPGNSESLDKFKEINRIHKILTDANKKQIYNEYGSFGLFIAEKYGDEEVAIFSLITSMRFQLVGLLTCCFCCCCYCCCLMCCDGCCGLCCKNTPEDQAVEEDVVPVEQLLEDQIESDVDYQEPIITSQPRRSSDINKGQEIFTVLKILTDS
ncbi:unnamed protein product [Allacma fusca]|uniref:J domain-containing protein n=1 Tax=Allacma fusca TaxID=39272 RepID=A0A8J2KMU7_9HEXA|nr:unnamed protein product [Allacma fusca]